MCCCTLRLLCWQLCVLQYNSYYCSEILAWVRANCQVNIQWLHMGSNWDGDMLPYTSLQFDWSTAWRSVNCALRNHRQIDHIKRHWWSARHLPAGPGNKGTRTWRQAFLKTFYQSASGIWGLLRVHDVRNVGRQGSPASMLLICCCGRIRGHIHRCILYVCICCNAPLK